MCDVVAYRYREIRGGLDHNKHAGTVIIGYMRRVGLNLRYTVFDWKSMRMSWLEVGCHDRSVSCERAGGRGALLSRTSGGRSKPSRGAHPLTERVNELVVSLDLLSGCWVEKW